MLSFPAKDPDEILDFKIDWTARLNDGDTITSSLWIVPAGLVKDSDFFNGTTATVWLSGGTALKTYQLTHRVTTSAGRTMDETISLAIRSK